MKTDLPRPVAPRPSWGRAAGFAAAISLLGFLSLFLLLRPQPVRVDISPQDGADEVPITEHVRIRFSRPMDRAGVEARLRLQPETPGSWTWEGDDLLLHPTAGLSPGALYTVRLEPGAPSRDGRTSARVAESRFRTRVPDLLYLGRLDAESEFRQLFAATPGVGVSRQLTDAPLGVWDYTVHPLGQAIVYSRLREDGGTDLWRLDRDGSNSRLLLACPNMACLAPSWSPDGRMLAYERRELWRDAPNLDAQAARIWLLDLKANSEHLLFDYDVPLHSPVWSPDGSHVAYVSPLLPGIEVLDLASGHVQSFGNQWSTPPAWSPDGRDLVAPDLLLVDEAMAVRLVRMGLEDGHLTDISAPETLVRDDNPTWSPGGGWIAFGRQSFTSEQWTPGRQIWLARPDGSEAYPLLSEPMADHFAMAWRPDGAALAFVRSDLSAASQPVPDVSVWVYDLLARTAFPVAAAAVLPRWLP